MSKARILISLLISWVLLEGFEVWVCEGLVDGRVWDDSYMATLLSGREVD